MEPDRFFVFSALSAINAAIAGKTYNSAQAVPIGTVACSMMGLLAFLIVLLDAKKLWNDLKMLRSNTADMCRRDENKVCPK